MPTSVMVPLSMQPAMFYGLPDDAAYLQAFEAGTTTPRVLYSDPNLTSALPQNVVVDASSRFPVMYTGEGAYKLRVFNGQGTLVSEADYLAGAIPDVTPPDPGVQWGTGDIKIRYDTSAQTGYVRGGGRTIGSSSSTASERANDDTQALFIHLWNTDPNLIVSPSRGASAAADWAANKTIATPDFRGRNLAGAIAMGGTVENRFNGGVVDFLANGVGCYGGRSTHTLTEAQLAQHDHDVFVDPAGGHGHTGSIAPNGGHDHNYNEFSPSAAGSAWGAAAIGGNVTGITSYVDHHSHGLTIDPVANHSHTAAASYEGGGASHNNLAPFFTIGVYIKL